MAGVKNFHTAFSNGEINQDDGKRSERKGERELLATSVGVNSLPPEKNLICIRMLMVTVKE